MYIVVACLFKNPATARDIGRIVPAACDLWIGECIERKLPEKETLPRQFRDLHLLRFPKLISKTVSESQTHMEIKKGFPQLPTTNDIKILCYKQTR